MYTKRRAAFKRMMKNISKKRALQAQNEQLSYEVQNVAVPSSSKEVCRNKTNMNKTRDNWKSGESKRKVLENVSNVWSSKQKSKLGRLDEKIEGKICLRDETTGEKPRTRRKKICTNPTLICKKQSRMSVETKQGQVLAHVFKNVGDIDEQEQWNSFAVPVYAKDIFDNLKQRETDFPLKPYMHRQLDIGVGERAIVVNWLVELQETFALTHETLYLAVKLLDHYLLNHICLKKDLQLLGATTIFISSKFVECLVPQLDDLVYTCASEYPRQSFIEMERKVLHELEFNINIPVAYSFIRRYTQCVKADEVTLTLTRYICEMTLQEFDFLTERASRLAASSLLLAMKMRGSGEWTPTLVYCTDYVEVELIPLVKQLNTLLSERPHKRLQNVFNKYSHSTFLSVAQIPPLDPSSFPED